MTTSIFDTQLVRLLGPTKGMASRSRTVDAICAFLSTSVHYEHDVFVLIKSARRVSFAQLKHMGSTCATQTSNCERVLCAVF